MLNVKLKSYRFSASHCAVPQTSPGPVYPYTCCPLPLSGPVDQYGDANLNDNATLMWQLCCNNKLCSMATVFQHRDFHKYIWRSDSLGHWSHWFLYRFSWLVPTSLACVRVKRNIELSNDYYWVICNFRMAKPTWNTRTCRTRRLYRILWEVWWIRIQESFLQTVFHPVLVSRALGMHRRPRRGMVAVQNSCHFISCSGLWTETTWYDDKW